MAPCHRLQSKYQHFPRGHRTIFFRHLAQSYTPSHSTLLATFHFHCQRPSQPTTTTSPQTIQQRDTTNQAFLVYSIREQWGAGYHNQNFCPVFVPSMWPLLRIRLWPGTSSPMKRSNYITSCYPSFIRLDVFKHLRPKSLITDAVST